MRKKSNKLNMRKQNSIILACFIISVLSSGCGIKGPLMQKPVPEKTQKQVDNVQAEQNKDSTAKQLQEN
jgi:predicted small lipoprotein YifL